MENKDFDAISLGWGGGSVEGDITQMFHSSQIGDKGDNFMSYSNPELDRLLEEAVNTYDRQRASELYKRIQEIVSRDVPVFPLWYQSNIVIARKNVGSIQVNASGDWSFVRNLTTAN